MLYFQTNKDLTPILCARLKALGYDLFDFGSDKLIYVSGAKVFGSSRSWEGIEAQCRGTLNDLLFTDKYRILKKITLPSGLVAEIGATTVKLGEWTYAKSDIENIHQHL